MKEKTIGEKMGDLMDEIDYHVMWYNWFSKYPSNKEIYKFDKMSKSEQIDFLKQKEKLNERI